MAAEPATAPPPSAATSDGPRLLDVEAVASLIGCSARNVYRLVNEGKAPRPVKVGHLSRWPSCSVSEWIEAGCPEVTSASRPR